MKPILKRIVLKHNEPENIEDFVVAADADIGDESFDGVDYFHFRIVSVKRLMKWLEEDKVVNGRATFVVNGISMKENLELVRNQLDEILLKCERTTWEETAQAINLYLKWEYSDM